MFCKLGGLGGAQTVDTFESPRRCVSPKTSTVTRMATLPSAILVTVDTFRIQESKNDDIYKETRRGGRAKPWKKKTAEPNLGKKKPSTVGLGGSGIEDVKVFLETDSICGILGRPKRYFARSQFLLHSFAIL